MIDIEELSVVCNDCGFPVVRTEYYKIGPKKGEVRKTVLAKRYPKTEEEALEQGWTDTGMGLLCRACSTIAKAEESQDAASGSESGVGTGAMATFLARAESRKLGHANVEEIQISDHEIGSEQANVVAGPACRFENHGDGTGTLYVKREDYAEFMKNFMDPAQQKRIHETYCAPYKIRALTLTEWVPNTEHSLTPEMAEACGVTKKEAK